MFAYDFDLKEVTKRLINYSARAREQFFATATEWPKRKPFDPNDPKRVIVDITDGRVFDENPAFARELGLTEKEIRECSPQKPIRVALIVYADAFTPIHSLSGVAPSHSLLAVLIAFINLDPDVRLSGPAIQLMTICNDKHAKAVG